MSRKSFLLSVVLSLVLLTGCYPTAPSIGPAAETPASACPTPAPPEPVTFHTVTLYYASADPAEAGEAFDYAVVTQEFSTAHIVMSVSPPTSTLSLQTMPPVAALGRVTDDLTRPLTLTVLGPETEWWLFVPDMSPSPVTAITCAPATEDATWSWQEVAATVDADGTAHDISAYNLTGAQVCLMPPGITNMALGASAADDFGVWIDAVVLKLPADTYGVYRFGPQPPGSPSGDAACRNVCKNIGCRSAVSCFVRSVCTRVCSR